MVVSNKDNSQMENNDVILKRVLPISDISYNKNVRNLSF